MVSGVTHALPMIEVATFAALDTEGLAMFIVGVCKLHLLQVLEGGALLHESLEQTTSMDAETVTEKVIESLLLSL